MIRIVIHFNLSVSTNLSNIQSNHQSLLERLATNDHLALREIYDLFWERLYYFAYNILKDEMICDDIVQEIFVGLWENRHSNNIKNLGAYLHKAVKFQCLKHIRSHKIANDYINRINQIQFLNQTEEFIHFEELRGILNDSIDQLPEKCREIFQLSRFDELSNQEIANKLGISIQTVKNQISKALQHIRVSVDNVILMLLIINLML